MNWLRASTLLLALAVTTTTVPADVARPFVRGSWKQLKQAHQGQPLVVHFWGVTCAPCMGELPKWGVLQRERRGAGLVFVAADPVPIARADIDAAIARTSIGGAENWVFADSFLERLRFEVSPTWGGELPYTVMIGADGSVTAVSGVSEIGSIRTWLASPAASRPRTAP